MLSVIVCTRDRPQQLERCLYSFEEAIAPTGIWELFVVVNDSSDKTLEVVDRFLKRRSLPLKYCFESTPGLSRARNQGIRRAAGEILAFADDDCLVSPSWLTAILNEFNKDACLRVLAGRVERADVNDLPIGIRTFSDRLTISSFSQIMERLIGCNMAFRREVFKSIGMFDTQLGAGTPTGSAEDTDIFYRAVKAGIKTCYVPEVFLRHAHGRTRGSPIQAINDNYAKGRGAFYCKHLLRGDRAILRCAYHEVVGLLKSTKISPWKTTLQYGSGRVLRNLVLGALSELRPAT
jgi:glycosyltransferase involved in cell wall biosynthesis